MPDTPAAERAATDPATDAPDVDCLPVAEPPAARPRSLAVTLTMPERRVATSWQARTVTAANIPTRDIIRTGIPGLWITAGVAVAPHLTTALSFLASTLGAPGEAVPASANTIAMAAIVAVPILCGTFVRTAYRLLRRDWAQHVVSKFTADDQRIALDDLHAMTRR